MIGTFPSFADPCDPVAYISFGSVIKNAESIKSALGFSLRRLFLPPAPFFMRTSSAARSSRESSQFSTLRLSNSANRRRVGPDTRQGSLPLLLQVRHELCRAKRGDGAPESFV